MAQIRLINFLKSSPQFVKLRFQLNKEQQVIYEVVRQNYPMSVIAGGYVSHNVGWKSSHSDVDVFIKRAAVIADIKKEAINLKALLVGILGNQLVNLIHTRVQSNLYWSKKGGRLFYRLVNHHYKIDIILSQGPVTPESFNKYQEALWDTFYILAGFDIILSRAAILDFSEDYQHAQIIRFGQKSTGLRELDIRITHCRKMIRSLRQTKNETGKRWIRDTENEFYDALMYARHQLERFEKYLPDTSLVSHIPEFTNSLAGINLTGLCYSVNPAALYSFTPCARPIKEALITELLKKPEAKSVVTEILNNLQFWLELIKLAKIPLLPEDKRCSYCSSFTGHPHIINVRNFPFIKKSGYFAHDKKLLSVYKKLHSERDWHYADREGIDETDEED